jgi:hypothetical protein
MNSPQKRLLGPGVSRWMTAIMLTVLLAVSGKPAAASSPDPVLEWIGIMNQTVIAGGTTPLVTARVAAMVSASVFDAVNGIERRYRPQFVRPDAQHPASQRAAAIQAAYAILLHVYPAQSASLTAHRNASLAALNESAPAINNGVNWGQRVADAIWNLRLSDGNAPPPPPFLGANVVGVWRPTPPLNASGAAPQYATMTPWVLTRPSLFRLPAPPALDSAQYQADLNEINTMGILSGSGRSQDQTDLAEFWNGNTPLYWNRIAAQISAQRGLSLAENARLFAVLNVSMADAGIACWDGKYRYVFWRPITAIRTGSAGIGPDPAWEPLLDVFPAGTPAHPEYPSGHSTVSGAAAFILADAFGEDTAFSTTSDVRPGTRSFASFTAATSEIADARVFGGIHYRTSCVRGNALGRTVADYVSNHAFRSHGDHDED